ncbi:MAG: 2-hydroxyacyl-CoA dehydratase family protein [Desulfosarcinaceae bacterium]
MLNAYFDEKIASFEAKLEQRRSARVKFALEVLRLGRRLYADTDRLAWCGVCVPFDLLNAMEVTSCFAEFIGGMLSAAGVVAPFLEDAEAAGFLADGCAWQRAVIGAAGMGIMPRPDFVIASSSPCSAGLATAEHLARRFDCPLFVLHVPDKDTAVGVEYLAWQLQEMIAFLTAHTGHKLDEDRLRRAVHKSNAARRAAAAVYELAQRVPSPNNGTELKNFGLLLPLFLGTQSGVDLAEAYRDEFTGRCAQGQSGVPDERFRLMWLQEAIQFKHPLINMLREEYQAVIVAEELNDIYWDPIDPRDPYPGLARRAIAFPFNGPVEHRLEHIEKLARTYRVDGAINPCHWGCRQGTGSRGLVAKALKELELPVVNLEVDCADARNFAEGQLRTRLEAFMEVLENRRGRDR